MIDLFHLSIVLDSCPLCPMTALAIRHFWIMWPELKVTIQYQYSNRLSTRSNVFQVSTSPRSFNDQTWKLNEYFYSQLAFSRILHSTPEMSTHMLSQISSPLQ